MMVKATQIGISTATAGWAIFKRCLRIPNHLVILLSRSERQSLELARKCKGLIDAYEGIKADLYEGRQFQRTEKKQHEIEFPNGSRIIALAANPDTARGYTGDMVLDEFAFHQDAEAIYKSAYGRMTNPGYQMRVVSTPNGAQGKFHALAQQMALDGGFRPPRQPVRLGPDHWSAHWADVHLAVEEGFPISVSELRAGCDEDTWLQEYCCNFLAGGSQWIPWELFSANIESGLVVDDNPQPSGLYAGWDIARSRDLSVVWFDELVGDVTVTRGVLVMRNMPTPEQTELVSRIMPRVHRLCIDKTGMGLPIFETMDRAFYGKVEAITFTQQTKETMATHTKRRLEERKCRLPETVIIDNKPDDQMIWQNFRSVRKTTTALGQVRFDAAHDDKFGHADFFWAKCLAESAAQQQDSQTLGLLDYYNSGQAEKDLKEMDKLMAATTLAKPMIPDQAPACPECHSKLVIRVGGGQLHCNQCGIQWWPKDGKRPPVPVASRKAYLEGR
jgi:phage FluMu gp28-like protein